MVQEIQNKSVITLLNLQRKKNFVLFRMKWEMAGIMVDEKR